MFTSKLEGNKRGRNSSFFVDNSVISNSSKKICDRFSDFAKNFSLSISETDFNYFHQNLHKMKKITQLNSTEISSDNEDNENLNDNEDQDIEIQQILDNQNPSLLDVMKGIAGQMKKSNKVYKCINSINKKLSNLTKKVDINSKNIVTLNNNANLQNVMIMNNLENVNYIKQDKIDREVFISGFGKMPEDSKVVIKELCKFYSTPHNSIKTYRTIPSKNIDGSIKGAFMNIEFCTKEDHIKFLKAVKEKGQPTMQALNSTSPSANPTTSTQQNNDARKIKISRRLTIENRKVIGRLRILLDEKKIEKIRFRNCFYEILPLQQERFLAIPSTEHLDLLLASS